MKRVEIFTDGACSGNPGAGGWGAILRYNGAEKELSGQKKFTTRSESGVFDGVLSRMKKWFADIS